jgi:tetratricopeptide (TPR) repeat protein
MVAFLGLLGYFLRIGLGVTGAALGPMAQQGDANIRATAAPADALPSTDPGDVVVPQTGGANDAGGANGMGSANGVGGGPPAVAAGAGAPPAPVMRLLTDLRGRVQRNPKDLAALVSLANLYFDAAKYPQAIAYYKRALALDPENPDTRTDYATALLDIVLASHPHFAEALFNEGIVANAIGRRTEAITAFRSFLKAAPGDQRAGDARTALQNLGAS